MNLSVEMQTVTNASSEIAMRFVVKERHGLFYLPAATSQNCLHDGIQNKRYSCDV